MHSSTLTHPPFPRARRGGAAIALVLVFLLAVLGCSKKDETTSTSSGQVDDAGFMIEPASEIGPHAFTAPFTIDPGACDKQAFLDDLRSRPDAYREWARVLGITEAEIPSYVATLQPAVLTADTKVTNHGLRDGRAYPRKSILTSGTAVLVDEAFIARNFPPGGSVPSFSTSAPSTTPPTTRGTSVTPTTLPGGGFPVTRCKCGNPLLPVGVDSLPPPPGTAPPGTGTTSTAPHQSTTSSAVTSSSVPRSTTSTSYTPSSSTPSSSVPPSSSSIPTSSSTPSSSSSSTTQYKPGPF